MKNRIIIVILFCLFIFNAANAQNFTLVKLQEFNLLTMSDFKTEVKNSGFSYQDKTESAMFNLFEYIKNENDNSYQIGKFEYKDNSQNCIQYTSSNKVEYDIFLKSIKTKGYKKTDSGKKYGELFAIYKFKNSEIKVTFPDPKQSSDGLKSYTIIVYK